MKLGFRAAIFVFVVAGAAAAAGPKEYFRVESHKEGNGVSRMVAINDGPVPVSVRFSLLQSENARSDRSWPFVMVFPPHSRQDVARMYPQRAGRMHYAWQQTMEVGEIGAMPDPHARYRLPFEDGITVRIGQAAGGAMTTHQSDQDRFAVDFPMPVGTPVVAARHGIVAAMETRQTEGGKWAGMKEKANYVILRHRDGTLTEYGHLSPGKVVEIGQWVPEGELIGYSGNTGYSGGPHLHFNFYRIRQLASGMIEKESLPVSFYVGDPPVEVAPRQHLVVTADYSPAVERTQDELTRSAGEAPVQGHASIISPESEVRVHLRDLMQPSLAVKSLVKEYAWLGTLLALLAFLLLVRHFRTKRTKPRFWDQV